MQCNALFAQIAVDVAKGFHRRRVHPIDRAHHQHDVAQLRRLRQFGSEAAFDGGEVAEKQVLVDAQEERLRQGIDGVTFDVAEMFAAR
jgi:hypothetical protein